MNMLFPILLAGCALVAQPVAGKATRSDRSESVSNTSALSSFDNQRAGLSGSSGVTSDVSKGRLDRIEHRKLKQQQFSANIDSLVLSHNFTFLPNSMQELPGGYSQLIYNQLYYIGVFKDHVEVHVPTIRGHVVQYMEMLNFDAVDVKNYQVSKTQFGWSISFNVMSDSGANLAVSLMVYTLTGEAVLNLLTLSNTVRYVGSIQPPME